MSKAGRMAASNVLLLKRSGDKRQENALQEAFKVNYQNWFFKFPLTKKKYRLIFVKKIFSNKKPFIVKIFTLKNGKWEDQFRVFGVKFT